MYLENVILLFFSCISCFILSPNTTSSCSSIIFCHTLPRNAKKSFKKESYKIEVNLQVPCSYLKSCDLSVIHVIFHFFRVVRYMCVWLRYTDFHSQLLICASQRVFNSCKVSFRQHMGRVRYSTWDHVVTLWMERLTWTCVRVNKRRKRVAA